MVELRAKFRQILGLDEQADWTMVGDRVVLVRTDGPEVAPSLTLPNPPSRS